MASRWLLSLWLCLLLTVASAIDVEPPVDFPLPPKANCYRSVTETPKKCAGQVLVALVFGDVHITKDCCEVLRRVGDETCIINFMCASIG
ncbi:hypothetical protein CFC21_059839 [Triticum aestivum]|uniref:Prolamin-like domain-containing protein n=2 Tax=Triticum aestivum TaxID=4565 RepID=A0A9R1GSF3_WHEAT|nr:hypothetical protein CFC21_059839 [Triticum aestivum]